MSNYTVKCLKKYVIYWPRNELIKKSYTTQRNKLMNNMSVMTGFKHNIVCGMSLMDTTRPRKRGSMVRIN